jgi:Zn-dependent M28 family amino/carboxypeptidase
MRALYRLLASVLVLAGSLFGLAAAAPVFPVEQVDTAGLRAEMSVERIRDHLFALDSIAKANGGNRAVGTPGYQASVDYVRDRLTTAGYQVTRQPFQVPHFKEEKPPTLRAGRTFKADTDIRTMTYSGTGTVSAAVQPVDLTLPPTPRPTSTSGCELSDFGGFSRGAVALLQRGGCSFAQKAKNAKESGATAVLIMNEGQPDRKELISGSLEQPGLDIPVLGLSYNAGADLAKVPDTPVRVATDVVSDYRETVNVIADGVGGRPDRVVMVGAHLDSVPEGPGINDDGSGVAVVLELADQLARQPITPRSRIRFAFWGGEELGTLGSDHYVAELTQEQKDELAAYLNFDMLGSPNFVRYVYDGDGSSVGNPGPRGSAAVERIFGEYLTSQGLDYEPTELDGRSDYAAFERAGVPVGGLFSGAEELKTQNEAVRYGGTEGVAQDRCYHQACDTLSNISDVVLGQLGNAAADAVLRLLQSSADPRQTG